MAFGGESFDQEGGPRGLGSATVAVGLDEVLTLAILGPKRLADHQDIHGSDQSSSCKNGVLEPERPNMKWVKAILPHSGITSYHGLGIA